MITFGMIPQCTENLTFGKDTNILKTGRSYNIYLAILNIRENKTNVKKQRHRISHMRRQVKIKKKKIKIVLIISSLCLQETALSKRKGYSGEKTYKICNIMNAIIVTKIYTSKEQTYYLKVCNLDFAFPVILLNCLSISTLFSVQ